MAEGNKHSIPAKVVELSHVLQIVGIRLLQGSSDFHFESFPPGEPEPQMDSLGLDITTGGTRNARPVTAFVSQVGITVRVMSQVKKLATLKGVWLIAYQAPSKDALDSISDDLAIAFNTFAAPCAIWPFAREFFTNLCWRMQIPPAMLPPFDPAIFPEFLKAGIEAAQRDEDSRLRPEAKIT